MLRVIVASWEREPLVACRVSRESPTGVLEADSTVKVCDEFALTVIGEAGLVDVPAGRPEIVIETDPLNPFVPTIDTASGTLALPFTKLTEVDENRDVTDTEKSEAGGGGADEPPPPQAIVRNAKNSELRHLSPCWYVTTASPLLNVSSSFCL